MPSGALGDEVRYVSRGQSLTGGETTPTDEQYDWGFRVDGQGRALDRTGLEHDVLAVSYWEGDLWWGSDGLKEHQFFHLGTRDQIQWRRHYGDGPEDRVADVYFGPSGRANASFAFQGETLRVGENLSHLEMPTFQRAMTAGTGTVHPISFSFDLRVVGTGLFQGKLVVGVAREFVVSRDLFAGPSQGWVRWDQRTTSLLWFAEDCPYPIRIESRTAVNFTPDGLYGVPDFDLSGNDTLVAYRQGSIPIGWQPRPSSPPYRSGNDDAERSSVPVPHPQDGRENRLRFPLSQATNAVRADPSLARFIAWRNLNKDAFLVGATLVSGMAYPAAARPLLDRDVPADTWSLTFAAPRVGLAPHQAFVVSSSRHQLTGAIVNQERGEATMAASASFQPQNLSKAYVTLDAVDVLWRRVGPANLTQAPPNFVQWGYFWTMGTPAPGEPPPPRVGPTVLGRESNWDSISLGWFTLSSPYVDGFPPEPRYDSIRSSVRVNSTTGVLMSVLTFDSKWDYDPLGLKTQAGLTGPEYAEARNAPVSATHGVARLSLAVASTILGGLLLLGYFFHALRFGGMHFLVFTPGYAKLRKEELLNNRRREDIISAIRADPGITPPQIQSRVGGGWSTIVYHLGVMEKNGIVSSLLDGRHRRFFPVGLLDHGRRGQVAVLRNDRTRLLFELISQQPGAIQRHLSHKLGVSVPSTIWHLQRLEQAGLVAREREGHRVRYFPRQEVGDAAASAPPMHVT